MLCAAYESNMSIGQLTGMTHILNNDTKEGLHVGDMHDLPRQHTSDVFTMVDNEIREAISSCYPE